MSAIFWRMKDSVAQFSECLMWTESIFVVSELSNFYSIFFRLWYIRNPECRLHALMHKNFIWRNFDWLLAVAHVTNVMRFYSQVSQTVECTCILATPIYRTHSVEHQHAMGIKIVTYIRECKMKWSRNNMIIKSYNHIPVCVYTCAIFFVLPYD